MGLFQRQLQFRLDILSTIIALVGSAPATEQVSKVKASRAAKAAKLEIAEVESSGWRSAGRSLSSFPSRRRHTRAHLNGTPILSVLIVELSILTFGQYIISFLQLLELFFRSLIAGVQVGMKLAREFAISLLDLVVRGAAPDAEQLVVVFCLDSHLN